MVTGINGDIIYLIGTDIANEDNILNVRMKAIIDLKIRDNWTYILKTSFADEEQLLVPTII